MQSRILIVDDEANIRNALAKVLSKLGYEVSSAGTATEGFSVLSTGGYQLVITDLRMPGIDGLSFLKDVKAKDPTIEVIVMTAYGSVGTAVAAMREGAYDYVEKPIDQDRLPILIEKALEKQRLAEDNARLRQAMEAREEFGPLIGKSASMANVYQLVDMVAATGATVLIQGESGVGKELIARAIHQRSPRANASLVSLNCGAIPEGLLESELFGFEKGAFTGADTARPGKIELAHKGTLFLDEVGEMSAKTQIELLRVLETRELRRLGGAKMIPVDIRVVAATNKILAAEVGAGRFREDLFYRLNVVPIVVPPLRDRREDVPLLTERFLQEFARLYHRSRKRLAREVIEVLISLEWPGNVRELRNLMERLTVIVNDSVVTINDLPAEYRPARTAKRLIQVPLGEHLERVEEIVIRKTLSEVTSHRENAARILGISPRALHYKLRRYGIDTSQDSQSQATGIGPETHDPDEYSGSKNVVAKPTLP
jgi:DNA-binding NtrC family response regulator